MRNRISSAAGRLLPLAAVLAAALVARPAAAAPLVNNVGIASPTVTITFSEVALAPGTLVTNQFAAFGATFDPGMFYDTQPLFFPTAALANYDFNTTFTPVTIVFGETLTEAAFAMQANDGNSIFEALLNDVVVESFFAPTTLSFLPDTSQASNFYGFTGVAFDAIRITPGGGFFQMDNLQLGAAAAPEPGTMALVALGGLATVAGVARRRR